MIAAGDNKSGRVLAPILENVGPEFQLDRSPMAALASPLFGAAALNLRGVSVNRLPEIHAPFWPRVFFQRGRTLGLAGFAPAFHQRRAGWAFVRICSGYSRCCRFLTNRRRRCRHRLRGRRKLERLFQIEISALRASSESKCKRQSEQPFHFVPPSCRASAHSAATCSRHRR